MGLRPAAAVILKVHLKCQVSEHFTLASSTSSSKQVGLILCEGRSGSVRPVSSSG